MPFPEGAIGQKEPAVSSRDPGDPSALIAPIKGESQLVAVIRRGGVDVADRYFGYRAGQVGFHSIHGTGSASSLLDSRNPVIALVSA
jgi:hypothetical protein